MFMKASHIDQDNQLSQAARAAGNFKTELGDQLPNLQKYARSFYSDSAQADDLVQDTIVRAMDKAHLYQEGTNLKAWLYRMMHNIFCNQHKRRKRYPHVDAEKVLPTLAESASQEEHLRLAQTQMAFNQLEPTFREALYLVTVEGMSYQQAAQVMDVKVGTVKSRISRARNDLLQKLKTVKLTSKTQQGKTKSKPTVDLMQYAVAA